MIRLVVRQGDAMQETVESPVTGGTFSLSLPIVDTAVPIAIVADLTGPSQHLVGALPAFVADETTGTVRIVVGPPGRCGVVYGATLRAPRSGAGAATIGTFAIVAGGEAPTATSRTIEFFDLLVQRPSSVEIALDAPLGQTQLVRLAAKRALVVGSNDAALILDLTSSATPLSPVALHAGAGARSATVALADRGAVVLGGDDSGVPSDAVTWVSSDGSTQSSHLLAPRRDPAAVAVGDLVIVAGGAAAGAPAIEWIDAITHDAHATDPAVDDGARFGAVLSVAPGATHAYLFGGVDASGVPRADALAFELCPAPCRAVAMPWLDASPPGAGRAVATTVGTVVLPSTAPADALRGVVWSADAPHADVRPLELPRTRAAGAELAAGIAAVFGGSDPDAPRDDVELCFPADVALP